MTDEQVSSEVISALPALALSGLISAEAPTDGTLPPMWHLVHLLDYPRQADIGPDGHPVRGVFPVPPSPGMRRMFAGGRAWGDRRLRTGSVATRRSVVAKSAVKEGSSGTLTFLTVRNEVEQEGELVFTEERDLVYRDPVAVTEPPAEPEVGPAVPVEEHEFALDPDPTLLVRFSAVTYNAHRIHYDLAFAREVEGYPGLVVHGPLQAVLMAEQVRRVTGGTLDSRPYRFEFRLKAPLFVGQGLVVGAVPDGEGWRTYARDAGGRVTAEGSYLLA